MNSFGIVIGLADRGEVSLARQAFSGSLAPLDRLSIAQSAQTPVASDTALPAPCTATRIDTQRPHTIPPSALTAMAKMSPHNHERATAALTPNPSPACGRGEHSEPLHDFHVNIFSPFVFSYIGISHCLIYRRQLPR